MRCRGWYGKCGEQAAARRSKKKGRGKSKGAKQKSGAARQSMAKARDKTGNNG